MWIVVIQPEFLMVSDNYLSVNFENFEISRRNVLSLERFDKAFIVEKFAYRYWRVIFKRSFCIFFFFFFRRNVDIWLWFTTVVYGFPVSKRYSWYCTRLFTSILAT